MGKPVIRAALPEELPEGCVRRMTVHMSFGDGGCAVYDAYMPDKITKLPIHYQYDTRKHPEAFTGWSFEGLKAPMFDKWSEVREHWPDVRKQLLKLRAAENKQRKEKK